MEEQMENKLLEEEKPDLNAAAVQTAVSAAKQEPARDAAPAKGSKYEQISTLGYVGIMLLLAIPVIGPIFMISWACGGCRKLQKRRFARAKLIVAVLNLALTIMLVCGAVRAVSAVMDQFGIKSMDEIGSVVESIVVGELNESTEKLIGEMIEDYVGGEVELSEEQEAQLGEFFSAYMNGEISLDEETLDELLKGNGF